uniref:CPBP family intramembrane metalloprotease n=1 Tax=Schlesneria paludicola TaxID=360056 RepID=A0A7C2K2Q1_9PLAN
MSDMLLPPGENPHEPARSTPDFLPVPSPADNASPTPAESCGRTAVVEFFDESFRPQAHPGHKPGPGLPESLIWIAGLFTVQIVGSLFVTLLVALPLMTSTVTLPELPSFLMSLGEPGSPYLATLICSTQLLLLLAAVVAVPLRFAGRTAQALNTALPHPLHVAAIAGLVLPLGWFSSEIYRVALAGWQRLADTRPWMQLFDHTSSVELVQSAGGTMPLGHLLLAFAIVPAVAEELLFRGVIGRGLVARWGMVAGVAMASLLFAVVHVHPVHVAAVIPIGIALHLIYLATRSFWAPVLLHFLNNAWATVASEMASRGGADPLSLEAPFSPALLLSSLTTIIVLGALLYRTRTRYLLADGEEWSPGYVTAEQPPADLTVTQDNGLCSRRVLLTAGSAWAAFAVAFAAELVAFAR